MSLEIESYQPTLEPPRNPDGVPYGNADWGYTKNAADVIKLRQDMERAAGRIERASIGRDDTILEGVYEGAYGGEAIVVDYEKDPELINSAVDKVVGDATDAATGQVDKSQILDNVFETD